MKCKKVFRVLGILLLIVIIFVFGCFLLISSNENEVGVEGETINFKTPGFIVPIMKGSPDDKIEMPESDTIGYKYTNQELFGEKGEITYYSRVGVYRVEAEISVSPESIDEKFDYICQYMKGAYQDKAGYYDNGLVTTNSQGLPMYNLGTDDGATGIVVTIILDYYNSEINISAEYLY